MKRQNAVFLSGKLANLQHTEVHTGLLDACGIVATLITDHLAYGGHHQVLFGEEWLFELQAFSSLLGATPLEVAVDGWLRSQPGQPSTVVATRVLFLNVTEAQRAAVARLKAGARQRAAGNGRSALRQE